MGLDLYIEARIREKKTGRIISYGRFDEEEDKGFFEICWWCSWIFSDIRTNMIEICNKYVGANYSDEDFVIPIPQLALNEIYAYLVSRAYLSDGEKIEVLPCNCEWEERAAYEKMNLVNADKLHDLLYVLKSVQYDNTISTYTDHILNKNDLKNFEKNPQLYEWEFRIFNSY